MTALTIKDLLRQAEQTEAMGIPVDWKTLCYRVLDTSQAHVDAMKGELTKHLDNAVDPEPPENPPGECGVEHEA